jgi:hypothetical protein
MDRCFIDQCSMLVLKPAWNERCGSLHLHGLCGQENRRINSPALLPTVSDT